MTAEDRLIVGRYRVQSRLGSGAMGVVWKAWDERLNRTVAVKELHLRPALSDADVDTTKRRAMREGRITARLMHLHAIAVYDVVEEDGRPCLIMEHLASESLEAVLEERGPLPVGEVAKLGAQVAAALAAAHEVGIVHRDVKPGNVLVSEDITKITDFGISRALGDASTTGVLAGTPAYLAPEVAQGGKADFHTDVFSLGSTLYASLEGAPPFGLGDNSIVLLHRVAAGDFEKPVRAGELAPVLLRMLETEPEQRPTMREVQQALEAVADGTPIPESFFAAKAPVAAEPDVPKPSAESKPEGDEAKKRRGIVLVAAAAVVLVGVGVAAFLAWGPNTGESANPAPQQSAQPLPAPMPEPPAPGKPETADAVVSDYYALMPGNIDAAWQRLTPDYQTNHASGYENFRDFWAPVTSVRASGVVAQGQDSALATITYTFNDGRVVEERTSYTLVRDGDVWKIASTNVLSSTAR